MKLMSKIALGALTLALVAQTAAAFAPTNFFQPFDPNLALYKVPQTQFRLGAQAEYGSTSSAHNWNSKKKNVLQLHNDRERVVDMLMGKPILLPYMSAFGSVPDSEKMLADFRGSFDQLDVTLFSDYKLPVKLFEGNVQLSVYMPIRNVHVKDVQMTIDPLNKMPVGTNQFFDDWMTTPDVLKAKIKAIDKDLDFGSWSKIGVGDLVAMLKWGRLYKQDKEWIRTVYVYFKGGVSIPTSSRHDVDKVFSVPLGHDGAVGIPFGVGLALNMKHHLKLGLDTEFIALLDSAADYRMKTTMNQTEILLLNKGRAYKDHGLTWKFNLYAKGVHLWQGFSLKTAYEYTKHDTDSLVLKTNKFDNNVVNSANSLQEWNTHSAIFQLNWDSYKVNTKMTCKPQLSIFYKLPINGKNVLDPHTFGGQLALNF